MDLAIGARQTFVMMEQLTRQNEPKIVERCTYPLTGIGCVSRIYTDHAVIEVTQQGLVALDWVEGLSFDELCGLSGAPLRPSA
jgi:3-oxoadipate CoA-transferase beta subunit